MAEYIDKEKLQRSFIERFCNETNNVCIFIDDILRFIEDEPAADVAEVKHGKWNGWHGDKLVGIDDNGDDMYRHYHYNTCSECDKGSAIKPKYCPNCGAKMDLED